MTRSRNVRGVEREAAILTVATRLFGTKGFHAVSLREVSAAACITHPTLLHYFPSKEALLDAVLAAKDLSIADQVRGLRTKDQLVKVMGKLKADNVDEPGFVTLLMQMIAEATDPDHPAHAHLRDRYLDVVTGMEDDLSHLDSPLPEGLTPVDATRLLMAVSDGLNLQWLYSPDDFDPVGLSTIASRLILGASPTVEDSGE